MTAAMPVAPRILWLTTEFFPPETGGTGMIAARLTHGLAERGFSVLVVTRQTLPRCAERETVGKVRIRRIDPAGRMKGAGWRAFPAMLEFIARIAMLLIGQRRHYDLVVVSGMKTIPITAVPVCRLLGKKCVVRVESPFEMVEPISAESLDMMHGVLGQWMSRVLKRMQRRVLRQATCVIAISQDIERMLLSVDKPPARIVRIPNSVDLKKFTPASPEERRRLRDRLGFPLDRTVVLYVGRLSRAKGVMMLIEAWPGLVAKYPNATLVMVGSGEGSWDNCEPDIIQYVGTHGLDSHVTLAGHSNSVYEYLQAADLFVSPSDYEGFSLTLVEALGCAIPVLTTSVGAAPQIIRDGENGFLCSPRNKRALAAALELALGQQLRWPSISRLARESVQVFDIDRVVEHYVELLTSIAQPPP